MGQLPQRFGSFSKGLKIEESLLDKTAGLDFGGGNSQDGGVSSLLPDRIHAGGFAHLSRFTFDI